MLGSENEYLTGVLTILIGPQTGWSIVVTMPLASTNQPREVRPKPKSQKKPVHSIPTYHVRDS